MPRDKQQQQSAASFKKKRAAELRKKKRQERKFKAVATENFDIASLRASVKVNMPTMKAAGKSNEEIGQELALASEKEGIAKSASFEEKRKAAALDAARDDVLAAGAAAAIARDNAEDFRAAAADASYDVVSKTAAALAAGIKGARANVKGLEAGTLAELNKANQDFMNIQRQMWTAEQAGDGARAAALKAQLDAAGVAAREAAGRAGAPWSETQAMQAAAAAAIDFALDQYNKNVGNSTAALAAARAAMARALKGVIPKPNPGEGTYDLYWCNKHFVFAEKDIGGGNWKGPTPVHFKTGVALNSNTWPALCHEHEFIENGKKIDLQKQWEDGGFSEIYTLPARHIDKLSTAGLAGATAFIDGEPAAPLQGRRMAIQQQFNGLKGAYLNQYHLQYPVGNKAPPMKIYFHKEGWVDIQKALRAEAGQLGASAVGTKMLSAPTNKEREGGRARDFFPDLGIESKETVETLLAMSLLMVHLIRITP